MLGARRRLFDACPPCLVLFEHKRESLRTVGVPNASMAFELLTGQLDYACRPVHFALVAGGVTTRVRLGSRNASYTGHSAPSEWHCVESRSARCAPLRRHLATSGHYSYPSSED